MQKILSLLRRCVEDYQMIAPESGWGVGVSGGRTPSSSLAGLAPLALVLPRGVLGGGLNRGHGHPGDGPVPPVADWCRREGIPFHRIPTQMYHVIFETRQEKNPCSMCAKMRRGALHNALREAGGIHKVALGHHFDDAVETFFLSLFYEGRLSCFQPVTYLDRTGITQIRPLLYVSEAMVGRPPSASTCRWSTTPAPPTGPPSAQAVKDLIAGLQGQYPKLKEYTFAAMQRLPPAGVGGGGPCGGGLGRSEGPLSSLNGSLFRIFLLY